MANASYPVLWSEAEGQPVAGRLTPGREALKLEGSQNGHLVQRSLAYRDLDGVRIGRADSDLLSGRPTLVVEQHDAPDVLVRPLGAGLLFELADLLAELCSRSEPTEQVAVVLSLRPDALEAAHALVAEGPPFDPADTSLARHEVFLTDREAIFVFSGADACESVRRIMRETGVWEKSGPVERLPGRATAPRGGRLRLAVARVARRPASRPSASGRRPGRRPRRRRATARKPGNVDPQGDLLVVLAGCLTDPCRPHARPAA